MLLLSIRKGINRFSKTIDLFLYIYNNLFEYFIENDLISHNQSGFKPGDSYINQLISLTHEMYQYFDDGLEVRGIFLDISKAFDKVWHEGLVNKLK